MTSYDGLMLGFVVLGMIWGAWKGAIWQVTVLASLACGYAVAHPNSMKLAPYLAGDALTQRMEALLLLNTGTSGGMFTGAWMLRSFLRKLRLQSYDRHVGMLLGAVTGAAVGMLVTLFATSLAPQHRPTIFRSHSGKLEARALWSMESRLPDEVCDMLAPFMDQMEADAIARAAGEKPGGLAEKFGLGGGESKEVARSNLKSNKNLGQKAGQFFEEIGRSLNNPPGPRDDNENTRRR